jgi:hypothetical protein
MINLHTGEQTYVARLRVRGDSGLDPQAARLRLASLFGAAQVHPAGLAPSAIVCIRRLDDPRPRTVSLAGGNLSLPLAWQQSVRASIEQLARRAPRPARESVGTDALCVVFADRAELLAALAGDWCEQRAATRWWWRSLFKETIDAGALVKLWRETPEYVPGALEHLARRHRAVPFARALGTDAARAILHDLTSRFALAELHAAISPAPHNPSRDAPGGKLSGDASAGAPESFPPAATREDLPVSAGDFSAGDYGGDYGAGDSPWLSFAPEASSGELNVTQQLLLGVGLALQRAPALARSRNFALRVGAWAGALSTGGRTNDAAPPGLSAAGTRGTTSAPLIDSASEPVTVSTRDAVRERGDGRAASSVSPFDGEARPAVSTPGAEARATSPAISSPAEVNAPARRDEAAQVVAQFDGAGALTSAGVEGVVPEVDAAGYVESERDGETFEARVGEAVDDAPPAPEAARVALPLLEAQIETRFGGLFHLVNLALFLELYGDFTAPAAPGIANLPLWDFVALLGRRMGGAGVESDAVWPLLARLAGRAAGERPGGDFRPPDAWRVPAAWLRSFPATDDWRWAISRRGARGPSRLQVVHPARFLVVDVPLETEREAETQLARELEVYAGALIAPPMLRRASRPLKPRGRTPLALWVEHLHLYARARLRLALGTDDARRAARLLCERHARVFVTATHVDVLMRLAELPFEVRVAGLDRDPGWVPAAGRVVAFHFE